MAQHPKTPPFHVIAAPREPGTVLDTPWRKFVVFGGVLAAVVAMLALSYFGRHWL